LQVAVEALLGRELGRVVAAFTLREVAVHDGHRHAVGVFVGAANEALLRFFIVAGKALVQAQWRLEGEQGDTVVAFLPMK
nr:hypothetical protein [Tanacetum cinerariifolium]